MWKNIKKFFKWIADHTGISWIARKISSGWKWLFGGKANTTQQNASQQEKSSGNERQESAQAQSKGTTTPKTLNDQVNPDQSMPGETQESVSKTDTKPKIYLESINGKLIFTTINKNYEILKNQYKNQDQDDEFCAFIRCDSGDFRITGPYNSQQDVGDERKSVSVTSVKKQNDKSFVLRNTLEMIQAIGLDENKKFVKITEISNKPFKTATLEQPNPNGTSHNITQQTGNNDSNGEATAEVKQVSSSTTTDQAPEQPASGSEVASPSETKNGSNNGAVVLYQMLHDQGRLHPSPELYDYLLRASLVKEMLFCKVAPNSLFTQPIPKQVTGSDHSR